MKKLLTVLFTFTVLSMWTTNSYSGNSELTGALIGAGSGAIIGHAIGGDPESALIGSAIGGIIGVNIGYNQDRRNYYKHNRNHYKYNRNYYKHNRNYYKHNRNYYKHNRDYYNYDRPYKKFNRHHKYNRHYNPYRGYGSDCRLVKKHYYKHGERYSVTKRICSTDRFRDRSYRY